jgi:hypothetical protein
MFAHKGNNEITARLTAEKTALCQFVSPTCDAGKIIAMIRHYLEERWQ